MNGEATQIQPRSESQAAGRQPQEESQMPRVRPATDILEKEDGFYIYVDMPGVRKEDLIIDLKENELTISGKTSYGPEGEEKYIEVEFGNGEYFRNFTLSDIVDKERIRANLKNGCLELQLPKVEKAQPKRIEIQAG